MSESEAAPVTRGLSGADLRHFLLRRLHSLTGVLPIGAFLVEHIYTNYQAVGPGGQARFDEAVRGLQGNPVIIWAEIFGIGLPILFHAFYGLFVAGEARPNVGRYSWGGNWRYLFQRLTGLILVFFIGYHVYMTRLQPIVNPDAFTATQGYLSWAYMNGYLHDTHFGVPTWILYIVGVCSATYHLANGLWGFLIHWGVTTGPRAQKLSAYACAGFGVVLTGAALTSLAAFVLPQG